MSYFINYKYVYFLAIDDLYLFPQLIELLFALQQILVSQNYLLIAWYLCTINFISQSLFQAPSTYKFYLLYKVHTFRYYKAFRFNLILPAK